MIFDLESKFAVQPNLPELDSALDDDAPIGRQDSPNNDSSLDQMKWHDMGATPSAASSISPSRVNHSLTRSNSRTSINSGAEAKRASDHLRLAKSQARLRELRLRVPSVSSSIIMGVFALLLRVFFKSTSPMYALQGILSDVTAYCSLLGFLPNDKRAVPLFAAFGVVPVLGAYGLLQALTVRKGARSLQDGSCAQFGDDDNFPCWIVGVVMIGRAIESIVLLVSAAGVGRAVYRKTAPEKLLALISFLLGCIFMTLCFDSTIWGILFLVPGHIRQSCVTLARALGHAVVGYLFLFAPDFRKRAQSWFMSRGRTVVTAAGIAELLGGRDIDGILTSARKSFAFVSADLVLRDAMEQNVPDPTLRELTQKGHLGHVDAFVSHSWHDDAGAKWDGLQELRAAFKKKHSREPKLWIDKYCINQEEISESLACLPVYLSGCSQLWILCGKTYLDRLWCIMEILIFLEMGGQIANLHVKLLGLDADSDDVGTGMSRRLSLKSAEDFRNSLAAFDPRSARCTSESDTETLQAVLEATGEQRIKNLVHDIFR